VDGTPFPLSTQAPLPDFRVKEAVPFEFCGTDYTGHLFVRDQHTGLSSKVYVLIFTCASTRCIHLELTQDLTAASFILAMRRFTARRSTPRKMISDNGSTFIAAAKILKGLESSPEVQNYLTKNRISWRFNPKRMAWAGGLFERMIAITKIAEENLVVPT
ncbi:uncharacterized protein LOC102803596, partial [Saccoglossus kowalevskii]|uniref:Uncharacterized protein LOC102803596 n=1 Tax=Saccoglossus kowalevskii TaxID=10224 RepID=A0ABM0LYS9_SACKO